MSKVDFDRASIDELSIIPPAASVGPSIPSVPMDNNNQSREEGIFFALAKKDKANS